MSVPERLVSIVLGPPPTFKRPITRQLLEGSGECGRLFALREGAGGTREVRDLEVVDPSNGTDAVLVLVDGRLQAKNPDQPAVAWMIRVADSIEGRVRDYKLLTYRSPTETYVHPEDIDARQNARRG